MPIDKEKQIQYWRQGSIEDLDTARLLLANSKRKETLFFAHLSLEKALKALVAKATSDVPPYSHDLPYLATKAMVNLSPAQAKFLAMINQYAIQGRYPDSGKPIPSLDRLAEIITETSEVTQWLIQKL